jgi:transcriptional regulator with GAF, ATPase, and Fis domain/polyferredoxin
MITVEDIRKFILFRNIPTKTLAAIIPRLIINTYPANKIIIYRGDPGNSMFMILSGRAAATSTDDESVEYTLSTMTEGDIFGEIALLTGEPRTANVKAITDVRVIELHRDIFDELVKRYQELNSAFFRLFAQRLVKKDIIQQVKDVESKELISSLLSVPRPSEIGQFLGNTKWVKDINRAIAELANSEANVLIHGERGSGRFLAARLIHYHDGDTDRPLLHLQCDYPPPIQREARERRLAIRDEVHLEIAQESALFGHGPGVASYASGLRRGYLEIADGGTLILENVEHLAPSIQRLLAHYLTEHRFTRKGETDSLTSRVRVIATTRNDLIQGPETGLIPELLTLLSSAVVRLKPLRDRKKDIPLIAESFLKGFNRKFNKNVKSFSNDALNALVDHDWPLNIDELHQVIERAVAITEGNQITDRQIFVRFPAFSTTGKINLLKLPFIDTLVHHRYVPSGLQFLTVPFMIGIILYTLLGPETNNLANLVVWSLWWPFMIFSIAVSARSWCGYCPLPVIANGLNFNRTTFLAIPEFLNRHGIYIGIAGFVIIFMMEHASHMFTEARATSGLLLTILSGAVITTSLFGRRSWCKHICPLGKVVGHFAALSLVELGSNSNVCSSQCTTQDCVKDKNCPMGIHPSAATATKNCVLCLSCLKSCTHKSIRIDARLPWQEMMARERWEVPGAMFTILIVGSVLAVKLPSFMPLGRYAAEYPVVFQGTSAFIKDAALPSLILTLFTALALVASGFPTDKRWREHFVHVGHVYLFLAFAGFLNIYFHEFVYNGHNLLPWLIHMAGLGGVIPAETVTLNLGTLKALIPLITLSGAIPSFFMLKSISAKYSLPKIIYRGHQLLLSLTSLIFLFVF